MFSHESILTQLQLTKYNKNRQAPKKRIRAYFRKICSVQTLDESISDIQQNKLPYLLSFFP